MWWSLQPSMVHRVYILTLYTRSQTIPPREKHDFFAMRNKFNQMSVKWKEKEELY